MAIISPWWFYLIDLFRGLESLFVVGTIACFFVVPISFIGEFMCELDAQDWLRKYGSEDSDYIASKKISNVCHKIFKLSSILLAVCSLLNVVIPSKETMYTMMVANFVTYENVEIATNAIKDSVDYIVEVFEGDDTNE